jgi:hypothetical protein
MNCRFCGSPPRTDWGYHCGTSQDLPPQRTNRCREAEVAVLKQHIKRLEEAGDRITQAHCPFLFIEWQQAKEAKP